MRKSDKNKKTTVRHYRSRERFLRKEDQWFYHTREGARGPFENREIAERELRHFADTMEFIEENEQHLPSGLDWKNVTIVDFETLPNEIGRRRRVTS